MLGPRGSKKLLTDTLPPSGVCSVSTLKEEPILAALGHRRIGLDHGIGHFMLFEVDSKAQAPVLLRPKSPKTLSAAADRKIALQPSSRQAG